MPSVINLQPQVLDLSLYAGDGFAVKMTCKNAAGAPVDITGAVAAEIRVSRLEPDPPVASFAVDLVDSYLGIIRLSLTGAQTQDLVEHASTSNGRFQGVWDVEWDSASGEPRTLCQGKVECVADVTR